MGGDRAGLSPNRPGAHYLRTPRLAGDLVDAAGVQPGELVVDLGAGWGALTAPLARRGARVVAVEADPRLAARLRRRFADTPRVTVVEGDALVVPLPRQPFRVVANIPFAITTRLLDRLLGAPDTALRQADVLVEWAAARRFTTRRTGDPNLLWWQTRYELLLARRVAAGCFSPPPSVDAAVLRAWRRPRPLVPRRRERAFRGLLGAALTAPQWAALSAAMVTLVEPARWPDGPEHRRPRRR